MASFGGLAQVCGCTDPLAKNYDANATVNDGSCKYAPARVKAAVLGTLDTRVAGTSTLLNWQEGFWTYNDHHDNCLYRIDSISGAIVETLCLQGVKNRDTEEIAQDSLYLYLGDIGNNSGTRRDLHFLRVNKDSITNPQVRVDTIWFSYEDQADFKPSPQATDFDCEAFVVTHDSLYLFTKQWASGQTTIYALPKTPGTHLAHRRESYDVRGLITGVTYIPEYQLIVLCGYDYDKNNMLAALRPFLLLLYDFQDDRFFSGNIRRLDFASGIRAQIEGIATRNALDYYVTCEHFKTKVMGVTIEFPAQLQRLDLREFLLPYVNQR
ncbi:MAG: hypothetical protein J5741_05025 [Bacteroidales bacterium]|nr:hypothetical protein [Bacteroidales bacterium]